MAASRQLLVVSHGFPPYYGGAEHAAGHLARAAAATGRWQVQVLTSDIGGRLPPRETKAGVEIVRVPTRKKQWARHTVPELISFLLAARRFAPSPRPDWILANCTLPGGAVARHMARRVGAPYAVVLQGSDVPGYQNARFGLLYALSKPWTRHIWRQAAHVIAVGRPLRDLALRTWPEGHIQVIPNGVDTDRFQPRDALEQAHPADTLVLLVLAQLIERKGIQHLLAALAGLPEDLRKRMGLRLCGTGPYEAELRRQAQAAGLAAQVEFAGLVPYEEVPAHLRAADVFVLPSLQEGLPLALLEAMASGLPVVATSVGGIPEVVRDGHNGFLVPPGGVSEMRDALIRLMENAALRARLAAAARETAGAWAWPNIWAQYETLAPLAGR